MRLTVACIVVAAGMGTAGAQVTGFVQARQAPRLHTGPSCHGLQACSTMVREGSAELLLERRVSKHAAFTLRVDASNDDAINRSRATLREAFADFTFGAQDSLKVGRQVLTWGVSDYLFVNDLFPKDYDAFFTGAGFDRLKRPVDAARLGTRVGGVEAEIVLSRSLGDRDPGPSRFAATAPTSVASSADNADDRVDLAVRAATHVGGWDLAAYLASCRARERRFFAQSTGLAQDRPRQQHLGASMAGNALGGLAWFEFALRHADDHRASVVDRHFQSSALKAIGGFSRELGSDVTATAQLQLETQTSRSSYLASLASGVRPIRRLSSVAHLRLQGRWRNQTLTAGAQVFAGGEGDSHTNPFVNWSPADGWTLEGGAHVFAGRPDTRFGALKDDSNVYVLGRYSF
jgi:hypothetical protein